MFCLPTILPTTLSLAIAAVLLVPVVAHADTADNTADVTFNRAFLDHDTARSVDRFERGASMPPGEYLLEVIVNKKRSGSHRVQLAEAGKRLEPCLTTSLLADLGLTVARQALEAGEEGTTCRDLSSWVEHASFILHDSTLQLELSLPQASLDRAPRGYVDPRQWDDGVTAASIAYAFNGYRRETREHGAQRSASLQLNSRLSTGGWRLRHDANVGWRQGESAHLQTLAASASHDLTRLNAQLVLGRLHSAGELFDSVPFDGAQISTDTRMLPDSLTGFAPLVRGTARTNAQVVIRQSGFVVYDSAVPPGPFEIGDLYATGYAGDLEVTVTESDGSSSRFVVPYAAVPRLLRPGQARYSLTAGRLRDAGRSGDASALRFLEGTYQRGLSNHLSTFGGVQSTDDGRYRSVIGGAALNTSIGAFSGDVTLSRANLQGGDREEGYSSRLTYSKSLPTTGTSVAIGAYRYSSRGFLSLREAADRIAIAPGSGPFFSSRRQRKSTFQVNFTQSLRNGHGSAYATGSSHSYWDRSGTDTTFQIGYSNRLGSGDYSISASRTRDVRGRADNQFSLSYAVPLWRQSNAPRATLRLDERASTASWNTSVSGLAGDQKQYNYNASLSGASGERAAWALSGAYNAPYASLRAGVSHAGVSSAQSFGITGGVVGHAGGVTLAPYVSDTMAIIHAPGAAGARVGTFGKVDGRGYAVVNSLRPYRSNSVTVDASSAAERVELETNLLRVAPRAGAVSLLKFEGGQRSIRLIPARLPDGGGLPFAADVQASDGRLVGQVAQGSLIYLRDTKPGDLLRVVLGAGDDQCSVRLPEKRADEIEPLTCEKASTFEHDDHTGPDSQ